MFSGPLDGQASEPVPQFVGHDLALQVARLSKLMDAQVMRCLNGSGLHLTWYRIALALHHGGEQSATDLSQLLVMDRAQISRATTELIKQGYLQMRKDPAFARHKLLSLTEAGETAFAPALNCVAESAAQMGAALSEAEAHLLRQVMEQLLIQYDQGDGAFEPAPPA